MPNVDYIEMAIRMCQSRMSVRASQITVLNEGHKTPKEWRFLHALHAMQQTDKILLKRLYSIQKRKY